MTLSQIAESHDKLVLNSHEPSNLTPMGPPCPTPGPAVYTLPLLPSMSALETVCFFFFYYSRCSKTYIGDLPGGPVVTNHLAMQRMQVRSLVGEPRIPHAEGQVSP